MEVLPVFSRLPNCSTKHLLVWSCVDVSMMQINLQNHIKINYWARAGIVGMLKTCLGGLKGI